MYDLALRWYLRVWRLQDRYVAGLDFVTDSVSQIGILAKTANQNDSLNRSLRGVYLSNYQLENFVHHRIKDGPDFSTKQGHLVFADA